MWQFLCGKPHNTDDASVVSLLDIFSIDNSIGMLAELPLGCCAERQYKIIMEALQKINNLFEEENYE